MMMSAARVSKSCSRAFLAIMIMAGLYACGFQLRGAIDLSEDISPVYIEQNTLFELARDIRTLLATNKIKIAKDESKSNTAVVLLSESKKQSVLSVDGSGRAREYLLKYTVNFVIKIKQSEEVTDSLSVTRSLLFDPDAVLAVTNEAEILYRDMQRDVARLILLRLQARSRNPGQNTKPAPAETDITQ